MKEKVTIKDLYVIKVRIDNGFTSTLYGVLFHRSGKLHLPNLLQFFELRRSVKFFHVFKIRHQKMNRKSRLNFLPPPIYIYDVDEL